MQESLLTSSRDLLSILRQTHMLVPPEMPAYAYSQVHENKEEAADWAG